MITINEEKNTIIINDKELSLGTEEGFLALSNIWLKSSWDTKQMYSFTWLGTPIIQLPEDLIRIQELIFSIQPDVIIETGVNYGGSLLFYASLCSLLKKGKVIGIELKPRPEMKASLANHPLSSLITLIEGNSIDPITVDRVKNGITPNDTVLVLLDSKHTKDHVLAELRGYAPLVSKGSYIIVMDGIMGKLKGPHRSRPEWEWNNPLGAIEEFLNENDEFEVAMPAFLFNGGSVTQWVTNCPNGFLRKKS